MTANPNLRSYALGLCALMLVQPVAAQSTCDGSELLDTIVVTRSPEIVPLSKPNALRQETAVRAEVQVLETGRRFGVDVRFIEDVETSSAAGDASLEITLFDNGAGRISKWTFSDSRGDSDLTELAEGLSEEEAQALTVVLAHPDLLGAFGLVADTAPQAIKCKWKKFALAGCGAAATICALFAGPGAPACVAGGAVCVAGVEAGFEGCT